MFRQQILSLISGWASYKSRKTTDASHLIHKLILDEIPSSLKDWTPSFQEFKFQGSDGQGNILSAPWVAVFNRNITESATKGYYIVYLLSEDLQRLVLEVGFGATVLHNLKNASGEVGNFTKQLIVLLSICV
jgi:5-methylcytosine-specific restriction protein A